VCRKKAWVGLLCVGVVAAFVPVSPSTAAAYAPLLLVTSDLPAGGAPSTTVSVSPAASDAPTSRSVIYVPTGYVIANPASGATIGSAAATAVTTSGATVTLTGSLVAAAAADYASSPCAPGPAAAWIAQLAGAGSSIPLPLLVTPAAASAAPFASTTISSCWPAPGSSQAGGLRLVSLSLTMGGAALSPPAAAGTYRWRAQLTPFAADGVTESPGAAVEAQALATLPAALSVATTLVVRRSPIVVTVVRTVNGKRLRVKERRVLVTRLANLQGSATINGGPLAGAAVELWGGSSAAGLKRLTQVTSSASGAVHALIRIATSGKSVFFQARTALASVDNGPAGCLASLNASLPCVSATSAGLAVTSPVVRLATGR
jgi:hypothetical protein